LAFCPTRAQVQRRAPEISFRRPLIFET